ncbi:hypothetical protein ACIXCX_18290 [Bacteroides fragilis]|uniref:hypothetical protein n=1 Tax=uncultured Bacteroides sp. TaxID=162156 RepID=UPI00338EB46E
MGDTWYLKQMGTAWTTVVVAQYVMEINSYAGKCSDIYGSLSYIIMIGTLS